jgi:hypothetical protein
VTRGALRAPTRERHGCSPDQAFGRLLDDAKPLIRRLLVVVERKGRTVQPGVLLLCIPPSAVFLLSSGDILIPFLYFTVMDLSF